MQEMRGCEKRREGLAKKTRDEGATTLVGTITKPRRPALVENHIYDEDAHKAIKFVKGMVKGTQGMVKGTRTAEWKSNFKITHNVRDSMNSARSIAQQKDARI
jgi:hypothetical protein